MGSASCDCIDPTELRKAVLRLKESRDTYLSAMRLHDEAHRGLGVVTPEYEAKAAEVERLAGELDSAVLGVLLAESCLERQEWADEQHRADELAEARREAAVER